MGLRFFKRRNYNLRCVPQWTEKASMGLRFFKRRNWLQSTVRKPMSFGFNGAALFQAQKFAQKIDNLFPEQNASMGLRFFKRRNQGLPHQ